MSDSQEIMKCPACNKQMKKVFIEDLNFSIDVCDDGCGGIFFDNREYKKFDNKNKNVKEFLETVLSKKEYSKVDTNECRICPNCGSKMVKNRARGNLDIVIDECYVCGGTFFDCNELITSKDGNLSQEKLESLFNYIKLKFDSNGVSLNPKDVEAFKKSFIDK